MFTVDRFCFPFEYGATSWFRKYAARPSRDGDVSRGVWRGVCASCIGFPTALLNSRGACVDRADETSTSPGVDNDATLLKRDWSSSRRETKAPSEPLIPKPGNSPAPAELRGRRSKQRELPRFLRSSHYFGQLAFVRRASPLRAHSACASSPIPPRRPRPRHLPPARRAPAIAMSRARVPIASGRHHHIVRLPRCFPAIAVHAKELH